LGCAENTVKVHTARIFEKLGMENRNAASLKAIELLSKQAPEHKPGYGKRFTRASISVAQYSTTVAESKTPP
jgi:hypothetical protein